MKINPKIIHKILASQSSTSQLSGASSRISRCPKERWSQMRGSSSLDFLLHLGAIIFHCPVNISVPSNRTFPPGFLSGRIKPKPLLVHHYQKQNLSDQLFIHILSSITGSLLRKFCQKRCFESKAFFCAPSLPCMLLFSCLTANILWLYSLSDNKCFTCFNGLFHPHITMSLGISGPILQLGKQALRDRTPSKWPRFDSNPGRYDSKYWALYHYNVWAVIRDSMFACLIFLTS